jgi:hypothetical protein
VSPSISKMSINSGCWSPALCAFSQAASAETLRAIACGVPAGHPLLPGSGGGVVALAGPRQPEHADSFPGHRRSALSKALRTCRCREVTPRKGTDDDR